MKAVNWNKQDDLTFMYWRQNIAQFWVDTGRRRGEKKSPAALASTRSAPVRFFPGGCPGRMQTCFLLRTDHLPMNEGKHAASIQLCSNRS